MTLKQSTTTFWVLVTAFVVSALYQLYRATLMEVPEFDAFTPTTGAFYLACVGVSALVLTDRRWAWWVVSVFVLALLAIGILYYYPVIATVRQMGFVDWLEGSVYMGLLFVAGFVCVLRLLDARLAPDGAKVPGRRGCDPGRPGDERSEHQTQTAKQTEKAGVRT